MLILPSEITSESHFQQRRQLLAGLGIGVGSLALPALALPAKNADTLPPIRASNYTLAKLGGEEKNTYQDITTYNNFYEFGTGKTDPAEFAANFQPQKWTLQIMGECEKPMTLDLDGIRKFAPLEERIYRFRCVEAWSMVIPWVGYALSTLLAQVKPTSRAKFVMFETLYDPKQMPYQTTTVLPWPYREGLRIDEAMNPLSLMAVGLYGKVLLGQNGAPLRLVVPWKYGFKNIKSIVRIVLQEKMPQTTWNRLAPSEYGFYANVNPAVDHPRWRQNRERRIGELFRRETLPFNGYASEVAHLYKNMDLNKFF